MSQYDDTNKGAIWKNEKRETDRHPHFTGQVNIDGVEYWVSAWKRDEDAKPNSPVLRLSFKPKDEQRKTPGKRSERFQAPNRHGTDPGDGDPNDPIPF